MNEQQESADTCRGQPLATQLKTYSRPQLISYGPVAQLTGGRSGVGGDKTSMLMMNGQP